jgi:hypothetical protein
MSAFVSRTAIDCGAAFAAVRCQRSSGCATLEPVVRGSGDEQRHSSSPLHERLNEEVKRRTNVVGILLNDRAVVCVVSAILAEQNHESQVVRRYFSVESVAKLGAPPLGETLPSPVLASQPGARRSDREQRTNPRIGRDATRPARWTGRDTTGWRVSVGCRGTAPAAAFTC